MKISINELREVIRNALMEYGNDMSASPNEPAQSRPKPEQMNGNFDNMCSTCGGEMDECGHSTEGSFAMHNKLGTS